MNNQKVQIQIIPAEKKRLPTKIWQGILFLCLQNPLPFTGAAIVVFCLGMAKGVSEQPYVATVPAISPSLFEELKPDVSDDMVLIEDIAPKKAPKTSVRQMYKPTSEFAPSTKFSEKSYGEYIKKFKNIAQEEMRKHGIPASISLAQGLVESRAGTSKLAVSNNNHFGMKCFDKYCKKGHCINYTDDTHKDFFRKFSTPAQSWKAHSELLNSGRYKKLKKYGTDYRKWAHGLKAVGYATDPDYATTLINVIAQYELYKYDR